jgi:FtsH-binding integral membrane protein
VIAPRRVLEVAPRRGKLNKETGPTIAPYSRLASSQSPSDPSPAGTKAPPGLRIVATVLRTIFICAVGLTTLGVSMPQNETIWTIYDTPLDVLRLLLGFAVCVWLAIQLFKGPVDAHGYRTWIYLGIIAVPFALICLVYAWSGQ